MIESKISGIAELVFRGVKVDRTITKEERSSLFLNFFFQINFRTPPTLDVSMDLKEKCILLAITGVPVLGIQLEENNDIRFFSHLQPFVF